MTLVLGVDGCRLGWCAVALDTDARRIVDARVYPSFECLLESPAAVIGVDIPIGLLDVPGQRACDGEARRLLGRGRASSVFPPPSHRSLPFTDYRTASDANFQFTGRWLNKQSFNIAPKVREVDDLLKPGMQERVREVHPELSFWALNRRAAMPVNKKKREGREERWRLLRAVLAHLDETPALPPALRGQCAVDDYVDSLVCAWTAASVWSGDAQCIPSEPQRDERGLRMEMWYSSP